MKTMRLVLVAFAACACAVFGVMACQQSTPPPVAPPDVIVVPPPAPDDAGADDPTLDAARFPDCTRACTRLRSLGCPEGLAQDGGLTCYAICAKAEASGNFSLNPKCVAGAASKDALSACKTVRCKQ